MSVSDQHENTVSNFLQPLSDIVNIHTDIKCEVARRRCGAHTRLRGWTFTFKWTEQVTVSGKARGYSSCDVFLMSPLAQRWFYWLRNFFQRRPTLAGLAPIPVHMLVATAPLAGWKWDNLRVPPTRCFLYALGQWCSTCVRQTSWGPRHHLVYIS